MHQLEFSSNWVENLRDKVAVVTGSARGIGASTVAALNKNGAFVVIVDLPRSQSYAQVLIKSLPFPERAEFISASVTEWSEMINVFKMAVQRFGRVDIVVANAGIMETSAVLDLQLDASGDPLESTEASRVIDINLKGTLNTLRLALHYLGLNTPNSNGWRGSIVLIASTSGYFGSTGNAAYIASKHGTVGLFRAARVKATEAKIRLNMVAPGYTPTHMTNGFGQHLLDAGVEYNTAETIALTIAQISADETMDGNSCLALGRYRRELEYTRQQVMGKWLGEDLLSTLGHFGETLARIGGYKLPQVG